MLRELRLLLGELRLLLGELRLLLGELRLLLCEQYRLFGYFLVFHQDFGISLLDDREILVLHVHVVAQLSIGGSGSEAVQYAFHFSIVSIHLFVEAKYMFVTLLLACLVENAEHLVQAVVDLSMQSRYLHDDA